MAWTTAGGATPAEVGASGVREWSDGDPLYAAELVRALKDDQGAGLWGLLSGVLEGGVCTGSGLTVTVPSGTRYLARVVWGTDTDAAVAVSDAATTYLWGCSDGVVRMTTGATPPTGFDGRSACILCKAVASGGTATVDLSVQQRAVYGDATNRRLLVPALRGHNAPLSLGRAAVSMTSDANRMLTASEQACMVLDVTSTVSLGAARDVVAPLTDGAVWIVRNGTTGGQAIRVIGASGSGVTIANGKVAVVFCDGTNVARATADA